MFDLAIPATFDHSSYLDHFRTLPYFCVLVITFKIKIFQKKKLPVRYAISSQLFIFCGSHVKIGAILLPKIRITGKTYYCKINTFARCVQNLKLSLLKIILCGYFIHDRYLDVYLHIVYVVHIEFRYSIPSQNIL